MNIHLIFVLVVLIELLLFLYANTVKSISDYKKYPDLYKVEGGWLFFLSCRTPDTEWLTAPGGYYVRGSLLLSFTFSFYLTELFKVRELNGWSYYVAAVITVGACTFMTVILLPFIMRVDEITSRLAGWVIEKLKIQQKTASS